MGRLRDEVADPWGVLVAAVAGGVTAVLPGLNAGAGAGVAVAVYGVKVATGVLFGGPKPRPPEPPPRPRHGTPAATWLARAEKAVRALDDMARTVGTGGSTPTDLAAANAAQEADAILASMRRLGGQSVALAGALAQAEAPGLDEEAAALRAAADAAPDDVSRRRSAAAVADRIAVRDRLRKAQSVLEGRMQSSALGLEGLVARVAELRATAESAGEMDPSADDLESLTSEVEGLRAGLAEVEQVANTALGGSR